MIYHLNKKDNKVMEQLIWDNKDNNLIIWDKIKILDIIIWDKVIFKEEVKIECLINKIII